MRRMLSNKNVVDVVNNAIEQGEIEVGGGLPEIESGDAGKALVVNEQEDGVEWAEVGAPDNVLVLPEEAPAAQQLVGINTSGAQNALGIGEGLMIENNNIKENIYTIDFNSSTTITNTDIAAVLNNGTYDTIKLINYSSGNKTLYFKKSNWTASVSGSNITSTSTPSINEGSTQTYLLQDDSAFICTSSAYADEYLGYNFPVRLNQLFAKPYLNYNTSSGVIKIGTKLPISFKNPGPITWSYQKLDLAGGTLTSSQYPPVGGWADFCKPFSYLIYEVIDSALDANGRILLRASRYDVPNKMIYLYGEYIDDSTGAKTATYTGKINCANGVYTITKHTA